MNRVVSRIRHHGMRFAGPFHADLDVATLEFELGDVLLDQKLYEFFELFLIHRVRSNRCPTCVFRIWSTLGRRLWRI